LLQQLGGDRFKRREKRKRKKGKLGDAIRFCDRKQKSQMLAQGKKEKVEGKDKS